MNVSNIFGSTKLQQRAGRFGIERREKNRYETIKLCVDAKSTRQVCRKLSLLNVSLTWLGEMQRTYPQL